MTDLDRGSRTDSGDATAMPILPADPTENLVLPFKIEGLGVRGRLVRMGAVADGILSRHGYPEPVAALLGEALALASVLSGALKYDGIFTLQTKGDGPVRFLVVDVVTEGGVRGYAEFDENAVAGLMNGASDNPVQRLLGVGHLAFTVDQGTHTDRYQGIVDLAGATMADCAHHYFRQSEQLETVIHLAARKVRGAAGAEPWRAAALMIQRLPGERAGTEDTWDIEADADEDGWRRAAALVGTVGDEELLGPEPTAERLLYRLFHEDGVRVYKTKTHYINCRCSRDRVARVLRSLDRGDLDELKVDGRLVVTCQFCNHDEVFEDADLDAT